jgi:hypothetical protein
MFEKVTTYLKNLLHDSEAIGEATLAGIGMVVGGAIFIVIGIFMVGTLFNSLPVLTGIMNTTMSNAQANVSLAFTFLGIALFLLGAIVLLLEFIPVIRIFVGGQRE